MHGDIAIGHSLIHQYAGVYRYYHSFKHVKWCVERFREVQHLIDYPLECYYAILCHDAVYVPGCPLNELKSAQYSRRSIDAQVIDVSMVEQLILSTKWGAKLRTNDEKLLHDIDYSILGASSCFYQWYCLGVAKEFSHINKQSYRAKRSDFLKLLLKDGVFKTMVFRNRFELMARRNIHKELKFHLGAP